MVYPNDRKKTISAKKPLKTTEALILLYDTESFNNWHYRHGRFTFG